MPSVCGCTLQGQEAAKIQCTQTLAESKRRKKLFLRGIQSPMGPLYCITYAIPLQQMNKEGRVLNFLASILTYLPFWDLNYIQVVSRCSCLDYLHWAHLLVE